MKKIIYHITIGLLQLLVNNGIKAQKLTKVCTLLLMFFSLFNFTHAQNNVAADGFGPVRRGIIYSGVSTPLGDFAKFAKTGYDFGFAFDYGISKKWGLGIDFNHQRNAFQIPEEYKPELPVSPNYSTSVHEGSTWTSYNFGIGPWWHTQLSSSGNSYLQVYSKAGISRVNNPGGNVAFEYNGNTTNIFEMPSESKTAFGITTGLKIGFKLNKNLSLEINPQYVYSGAKFEYSFKDINKAYSGGKFNPAMVSGELPDIKKTLNPCYFNVNIGVAYVFGFGPIHRGVSKKTLKATTPIR